MSDQHTAWMQQAIAEARRGEGLTRPNPPVGAVIVKNGKLVAKGYHRKAGTDHAEKIALKKAGDEAQGAVMYVTLEPCCTEGRTPPCTKAIMEAGISKVIVGSKDPNPVHNGRGIRMLRHNGIQVVCGVRREQTDELIEGFVNLVCNRQPFVTLKMAVSMDGRIADRTGKSKWITGPEAREYVQQLRRKSDAILVGVNTVIKDDPSLLPRPAKSRAPYRIIVDNEGIVPLNAQVLNDDAVESTIVAVPSQIPEERINRIRERGADVWCIRATKNGLSLSCLMRRLGQNNVMNLLCEGGGIMAESLIRQKRVNRMEWFVAPCIIGSDGRAVVSGAKGWLMHEKPEYRFQELHRYGNDVLLRLRIK